jgi:hypothetical protein
MEYSQELEDTAQELLEKNARCVKTPVGDLYKITMPDGWQITAKDTRELKLRVMRRMKEQDSG